MTEMIRELMIQSVGAFLAVFGFSLLVDMPRKYLVYAGITGGAGWLADRVFLVKIPMGVTRPAVHSLYFPAPAVSAYPEMPVPPASAGASGFARRGSGASG